jgi:hypothetical protein
MGILPSQCGAAATEKIATISLYAFLTTRRECAQTVARAQQSQSFGRKRAASARFMAKRQ